MISIREIAEEFNITKQAVYYHIHHDRVLKAKLKKVGNTYLFEHRSILKRFKKLITKK